MLGKREAMRIKSDTLNILNTFVAQRSDVPPFFGRGWTGWGRKALERITEIPIRLHAYLRGEQGTPIGNNFNLQLIAYVLQTCEVKKNFELKPGIEVSQEPGAECTHPPQQTAFAAISLKVGYWRSIAAYKTSYACYTAVSYTISSHIWNKLLKPYASIQNLSF